MYKVKKTNCISRYHEYTYQNPFNKTWITNYIQTKVETLNQLVNTITEKLGD